MSENTKGLLVAFGGLALLEPNPDEHADSAGIRSELMKLLNSDSSVQSISDLYEGRVKKPIETFFGVTSEIKQDADPEEKAFSESQKRPRRLRFGFSPVFVTIRIPAPLQEMSYQTKELEPNAQKVEVFHLVYDGMIVLYAAEIDCSLPVAGLLLADSRETFEALLGARFKLRSISPNVTHTRVLVGLSRTKPPLYPDSIYIPMQGSVPPQLILRALYEQLEAELIIAYGVNDGVEALEDTRSKILSSQGILTRALASYLSTKLYSSRKRRSILSSMRKRVVTLLALLSEYDELSSRARRGRTWIERSMRKNKLFDQLAEMNVGCKK